MKRLILSVIVLLMSAAGASGQTTGSILGVVKDQSGAVIPGANVSARETQTNQTRTGKTNSDGTYRLNTMPIGTYEVKVENAGFQTEIQSGMTLSVGQELVANFNLQVGSTTQSVEVSVESANLIETTSSSVASLVNQQQIADLPLNGRNYNDLTLLQPGVTKSLNSSNLNYIGYNGTAYSSNGATQRSNMYLLDGAIQAAVSGNNGSSALGTTLGVDGIQEYKVITSSPDAEYGMVMGSMMTIVTKSGTNRFHGDAFDFLRNNVFDARNYFDLPPSKILGPSGNQHRNPVFHRNQFGGALGGPIRKDKTFFFVTYEGLRAALNTTNTTSTLGTLANPNGCHVAGGQTVTLAQCPQLGAAQATVLPQMAPYLDLYPAPNLPGTNGGIASNYGFTYLQVANEDYGQVRIDHTISSKDNLFGRWTYDTSSLPLTGPFKQSHTFFTSTNQFFTLSETHVVSPSMVNSARFSFTREPLIFGLSFDDPRFLTPAYELVPPQGFGSISVTGLSGIGITITSPRAQTENIFTGSDDLSYNHGRHSLKFGALFNHYQYILVQHGQDHGSLAFGTLAAMMQGGPVSSFATNVPDADNVTRYVHFNTMGFYAQDSWKVTQKLTVNYGMRYEPTTTAREINGNAGILRNFPADATFTRGYDFFTNPSLKNFSPRLGFAYDVFGNGKTAIRGGADILYDLATWGVAVFNAAGFGPPLSESLTSTNYTATYGTVQIPLKLPKADTFQLTYRGIDYHQSQPHLLSYNVAVQQQLPFKMAVTVGYAGSHGINLLQSVEGNNVIPSGIPGLNPSGHRACIEQPAGMALNNAVQFDSPDATDCYAISTTSNPQCWPANGKNPSPVPGAFGNKTDCWSRENSNVVSLYETRATGNSYYNAMNVTLNRSMSRGLQFQAAYTYAKIRDGMQGVTSVDAGDIPEEPLHPHTAYGPSFFDLRNNFHFNANYRFPNFVSSKGFFSKVVDGWGMNGILAKQTGYPFSAVTSVDHENINYRIGVDAQQEPNLAPGRNGYNITHGVSTPDKNYVNNAEFPNYTCATAGQKLGTQKLWYDPCAFDIQPAGFIGTEPRNILRGPGLTNVDASIIKDTHITEGTQVEFRAEFFDLFNHPLFALPNATVSTGNCAAGTADPTAACPINVSGGAGSISSTIGSSGGLPGGARQIQFGLKFMF